MPARDEPTDPAEHPLEARIAQLWALDDATDRQRLLLSLLDADPDDARLMLEWAAALEAAGHRAESVPAYAAALRGDLPAAQRARAVRQLAATLEALGRHREADDLRSAHVGG